MTVSSCCHFRNFLIYGQPEEKNQWLFPSFFSMLLLRMHACCTSVRFYFFSQVFFPLTFCRESKEVTTKDAASFFPTVHFLEQWCWFYSRNRKSTFTANWGERQTHHVLCIFQSRLGFGCERVRNGRGWRLEVNCCCIISVCVFVRNVAKMEEAEVKIDDGKDDSVVPDTMYQ